MTDKFNEKQGILLQGYIKITDPTTGEVLVDKRNAIHYENMSISLADSLSNQGQGMIYQMAFGNGGTTVDPTGIIHICHQTLLVQMLVYITKHTKKLLMIIVLITQILQEIN